MPCVFDGFQGVLVSMSCPFKTICFMINHPLTLNVTHSFEDIGIHVLHVHYVLVKILLISLIEFIYCGIIVMLHLKK